MDVDVGCSCPPALLHGGWQLSLLDDKLAAERGREGSGSQGEKSGFRGGVRPHGPCLGITWGLPVPELYLAVVDLLAHYLVIFFSLKALNTASEV